MLLVLVYAIASAKYILPKMKIYPNPLTDHA